MLKLKLKQIIEQSAATWSPLPRFDLERPKVKEHGEYATNLAMLLAKQARKKPQEVAQDIIDRLQDSEGILEKVSIAGAGFLNFVLKKSAWQKSLRELFSAGGKLGHASVGQDRKVVIEYVSANPTGPLHIGNARGGPLGDTLATLLHTVGYEVTREYYVNDVGGQIDKLGEAIDHYLSNPDGTASDATLQYKGAHIEELAQKVRDSLEIEKLGEGPARVHALGRFGIHEMMQEISRDCEEMGIRFDSWVSEKEILALKTQETLRRLEEAQVTLKKEGAAWFAPKTDDAPSEDFLADRESVLIRSDGRPTYFANDIAYHAQKYEQGFERLINVWGSNHHGHVPRLQAAMRSLGYDPKRIETVLYQYVRVKRGADVVKMSKRGGNFVTAREVLDEVGRDAFRFYLLMRAPESHLDFDLELATKQSQDNPVYYVQYAHARLCAIERKASEMGISPPSSETVNLSLLDLPEEIDLIRMIHEYPEEVLRSAEHLEPHRIPFYLLDLARLYQSYYSRAKEDDRYRVLVPGDVDTSQAKMYLCAALKLTLAQGLKLLGVSAPEAMEKEKSQDI